MMNPFGLHTNMISPFVEWEVCILFLYLLIMGNIGHNLKWIFNLKLGFDVIHSVGCLLKRVINQFQHLIKIVPQMGLQL